MDYDRVDDKAASRTWKPIAAVAVVAVGAATLCAGSFDSASESANLQLREQVPDRKWTGALSGTFTEEERGHLSEYSKEIYDGFQWSRDRDHFEYGKNIIRF